MFAIRVPLYHFPQSSISVPYSSHLTPTLTPFFLPLHPPPPAVKSHVILALVATRHPLRHLPTKSDGGCRRHHQQLHSLSLFSMNTYRKCGKAASSPPPLRDPFLGGGGESLRQHLPTKILCHSERTTTGPPPPKKKSFRELDKFSSRKKEGSRIVHF